MSDTEQPLDAPVESANIDLYVDLDGTLVRTDTLYEQVLGVLRVQFWVAFLLPIWLFQGGIPRLKDEVAKRANLAVDLLPYSPAVLEHINATRAAGGQVVLATAAHERIARQVADHLGLFDDVIATTAESNLKGAAKLAAIQTRQNGAPFAYLGDHRVDGPLWQAADQALGVGLDKSARSELTRAGGTELGAPERPLLALAKACRPHQWLKNGLLFVPLLLAHRFTDPASIADALIGFFAFSLSASGVYLLNDLLDIDSDRQHATKCRRPFASGDAPILGGVVLWGALTVIGLALAASLNWKFLLVLLGYLVVTNLYSFRLKRVIMLDVGVLAGLYTIRIIGGSEAIDVPLSFWLLSFSMFLFLSLALLKRYCEMLLMAEAGKSSASGRGYHYEDRLIVSQLGTASGLVAVLVMALFVNSPDVLDRYHEPRFIWMLCPLVMYWIGRIWLLAHRGKVHEDPVVFAAKDPRTMLVGAFGALFVMLAV